MTGHVCVETTIPLAQRGNCADRASPLLASWTLASSTILSSFSQYSQSSSVRSDQMKMAMMMHSVQLFVLIPRAYLIFPD